MPINIYPPKNRKEVKSVESFIGAMIKQESGGNPKALSPAGARGLMQIMPVVLQEYNQFKKTNFNLDDLYNPEINKTIGTWYFNERIPQMLNYFNIPDTFGNRLHAYNAGIGNLKRGIKPKETINYIDNVMKYYNEAE